MTTNTVHYRKAAVGDDTPFGEAIRFCDANPQNGWWACGTHEIHSFRNAAEMAFHIDDSEPDCLIVFRCRECGQPHGFRAGAA